VGPVIARLTGKQMKILSLKPNKGLNRISQMFESGTLDCVIDGPFSLANIPAAIDWFGRAEHVGKIVVNVISDAVPGKSRGSQSSGS
jgi:NADPH:quinone reductase-like Zn-dependent oxidoreductase